MKNWLFVLSCLMMKNNLLFYNPQITGDDLFSPSYISIRSWHAPSTINTRAAFFDTLRCSRWMCVRSGSRLCVIKGMPYPHSSLLVCKISLWSDASLFKQSSKICWKLNCNNCKSCKNLPKKKTRNVNL